jgi:DNA-binding CsgD family transcriptional regulator
MIPEMGNLISFKMTNSEDYILYHKFIETYLPQGFNRLDREDFLLVQLEELTEANNQFFYVADVIGMKIHFTSKRSSLTIGIPPEDLTFYHFMEATHPDDIQRLNLGRTKLVKMAQDLFIAEKGHSVLCTNIRMRVPSGEYSDFLIQCYLFYTTIPYKTVFFLKIHTNIDWHKKIKHGYHYYTGDDLSYLRYPDDEMLMKGNIFSDREFEIIRLIEAGFDSEKISEKLFLSVHTVNTHRRNMLDKSGKASMSDLIFYLKERGVL